MSSKSQKAQQRSQRASTQNAPAAPVSQPVTTAVAPAAQESTTMSETSNTITLTLKRIQKNGIATYNQDGVNASVYFNKTMFKGDPPQTVQITADSLTKPGEGTVAGRTVDPAKLAQKNEQAQARMKKAQERLDKAKSAAEKLAARVSGTAPAADEDVASEGDEATE